MAEAARCLVIGGSGKLGGAVCRALAARGARVAFTYRSNEAAVLALAAEIPAARAFPLDVSSIDDLNRTIDAAAGALGGIDAFAYCAGVGITMQCSGPTSHHRMPQIDEGGWDRMMAVNAKGAFFAARRLIGIMEKGGNIVFVGSVDGVKCVPSPVHYAASKAALRALTTSMAKEVGGQNLRVNHVAPGILEGGLSRDIPANLLDEYVKHCALKRVGKHEEVAALVAWLALENTYVTGQTIVVDGAL